MINIKPLYGCLGSGCRETEKFCLHSPDTVAEGCLVNGPTVWIKTILEGQKPHSKLGGSGGARL